jgi:hypothetical protein
LPSSTNIPIAAPVIALVVEPNREQGIGVDRFGLPELSHAVALGEDDLAVLHHRDCEAHRVPFLDGLGDVRIELGRKVTGLLPVDRGGGKKREEADGDRASEHLRRWGWRRLKERGRLASRQSVARGNPSLRWIDRSAG